MLLDHDYQLEFTSPVSWSYADFTAPFARFDVDITPVDVVRPFAERLRRELLFILVAD
jgi:hypothetical protein